MSTGLARCALLAGLPLLALTGCGGGAGEGGAARDAARSEVQMPLPEERAEGVPDECFEAYPWATGPADLDDLSLVPANWPSAPDDATLCVVAGGGVSESAAYVSSGDPAAILDHYESALDGYQLARVSGEQNGTGYESLDGSTGALSFQIREAERGFLITFISENALD